MSAHRVCALTGVYSISYIITLPNRFMFAKIIDKINTDGQCDLIICEIQNITIIPINSSNLKKNL